MKKAIIITILSTSFIQSFAQVNIGIKAGLNLSNVKFPEPSATKIKTGFYGGLVGQIYLAKKFLVQPEVLYSGRGFRFSPIADSKGGYVSLNYISVPLLAGYCPVDKLKILLGPEFNFLTTAKSKIENTDNDLSNIYKKFDLGIDLGASYEIQKSIGVEVRYSHGITDLLEGSELDNTGNEIGKIKYGKNRVFQIGIFYKFGKKGS